MPSCQRHDFGYRSYKKQDRFDAAGKTRIDSNFKKDLDNQCETEAGFAQEPCHHLAEVYYAAVREFGRKMRREVES